jgi:hypothetical protein
MIIPLLARNTTAVDNSATNTDTDTHAHTSLAHRNLVGVLVIAALLVLALSLSLCFAKWSKPIRRFLRRERGSSSTRVRCGVARDGLPTLSKAPPPPPPPPTHAADAEKEAVTIPDSSSTQYSLDKDMIEIDEAKERANVQVALPAKVRKVRRC